MNCKYCGRFISPSDKNVGYNDIAGFLEIQETEVYHLVCLNKEQLKISYQKFKDKIN